MKKEANTETLLKNAPWTAGAGAFWLGLGIVESVQRSMGFWPPFLGIIMGAFFIGLTVHLLKSALLKLLRQAERHSS